MVKDLACVIDQTSQAFTLEEIWPAAVAVKTVPVKPLATPLVMAAGVPPLKMRDVGW